MVYEGNTFININTFDGFKKAFNEVSRDVVWWALRKISTEGWLINITQSMYRNFQSRARVKGTFNDNFLVQAGFYQDYVLGTLLFIIVLEALSMENMSGCPKELLLYIDDLVLMRDLKGKLKA